MKALTPVQIVQKLRELYRTQSAIASAVNVTQTTISKMERGQTKSVSAELAIKLADASKGTFSRADIRPDIFNV